MNSKTAILLFNRSAYEEAEAKEYFSQVKEKKAIQLSRELRNNSLKICKQSGLPIINFNSKLQKGANFGKKITHAIQASFQEGYENLIVIGIDSPGLNYRHIKRAWQILEGTQSTVLGPSLDGGVYLIGINKSNFNPQEFIELAWQSENLQESWSLTQNEIVWLNALQDLDEAADLWAFAKSIFNTLQQFHHLVLLMLQIYQKKFLPLKIKVRKQTLSPSFGFRAPPSLF
ncbi:TIGR04282 family arsenosugar biosynthesis glycosyltransferase [Marivirga sp.]|uniref:TIGR04282 family arsenosugar biosynthesis glycosyltransferase n=1 Tax=Marivirga sp. TaxID=2018662 RepID=UPI003DA6EAE8